MHYFHALFHNNACKVHDIYFCHLFLSFIFVIYFCHLFCAYQVIWKIIEIKKCWSSILSSTAMIIAISDHLKNHRNLKMLIRVAVSDRKSNGSPSVWRRRMHFWPKTDSIAVAETEFFQNPIRFSPIKQYASLIGLKRIGSNAIFSFFVGSDRIGFIFIFCRIGRKKLLPIRSDGHPNVDHQFFWIACFEIQIHIQQTTMTSVISNRFVMILSEGYLGR